MVVPILGEAKALKAEKLLATVEKTEPFYDDFVRLSKELEGKSADEAVKILSKEKGVISYYTDNLLNEWARFTDNASDVADAGLKNWKIFQNSVGKELRVKYPNAKIGDQITLDVTYIDEFGKECTETIIPDNLIQNIDEYGDKTYKVIDAKTSIKNDLTKGDLTNTCTKNQKPIYSILDGEKGKITKVEMRGGQAEKAFELKKGTKQQINLEQSVEFWVNADKTDFTKYLIRTLK